MKQSDYAFVAALLKTTEGKRVMGVVEEICEVKASAAPGEEGGAVCSNLLAIQAGRRSVYNKLRAAEQLGDKIHES